MKMLPQVLFWLGIVSIPLAWMLWYLGPGIEFLRPVLSGIDDLALRAVLREAHAERLGIWVGIWPVTLLLLSHLLEKKMQE
ncbi:MAG: hypothetical protein ISR48_03755 [Alphaproteobacteria bacterium]|nr:hypothetical protein [Alphaproteobacteria bacterium]